MVGVDPGRCAFRLSAVPIGDVAAIARVLIGLCLIGFLLAMAAICAMKGKWVFFALGWLSGIFWIVGAARLAKPNSRWAVRRYGDVERERAMRRFARRPLARMKQPRA